MLSPIVPGLLTDYQNEYDPSFKKAVIQETRMFITTMMTTRVTSASKI
jgi:hypothetical protein